MFKVPERYRLQESNYRHYDMEPKARMLLTTSENGNTGVFFVPMKKKKTTVIIEVICSDAGEWEHCSVVIRGSKRNPLWNEMNFIKDMFWGEDDAVFQFHPPKSDYVNNHNWCLHLFRPISKEFPLPPSIMVGIR